MMFFKLITLLLPFIGYAIYEINQLEVDPIDFSCHYRKQIKGDLKSLFPFLTSPYVLEKLLPWLTRFNETDKRIISPGKSYTAVIIIPILGERRIYATLTNYKPLKLMAFEFSNDYVKQKIIIQMCNYHDRSLLQTTIYFQQTSLIYQYTIGYILRSVIRKKLEKSTKNLATMIGSLIGTETIPHFARKPI
ncbi:PREDICTED: uncharacterized protein LOC105364135 [Ceratosolen solmsi marchali]|uniref:Uncharacterized protein LOC105364135 n=1 Tax=Ceratosolen solmsi marchali TaxID=326594 RepID=A0AAJ6YLM2_9HYME|nr:PREDICTED: uncharacterized protein LOC105364135 [Ceratosolen solmsi marchali]